MTGQGSADVDWATTRYRLFGIDDLDNYWFLQNIALLNSQCDFALDNKGCGYLAGRYFDNTTKGGNTAGFEGRGTIRKINLSTGKHQNDFTWNGLQKLESPSAFLGTAPDKNPNFLFKPPLYTVDKPEIDSESRFADMRDVEIDSKGRILVVDSRPRRVKVFEANGKFSGFLDSVILNGNKKQFYDIRSIKLAGKDIYFLASVMTAQEKKKLFPPPEISADGKPKRHPNLQQLPMYIIKCTGDILSPVFVWQTKVHKDSKFLALDTSDDPRIVWFGNGNGLGSFSRLVDDGKKPGELKHFGGGKKSCFQSPVSVSIDGEGRLFVSDIVAGRIIRTNDQTTEWKVTKKRSSKFPKTEGFGPTLFVDRINKRLYATPHGSQTEFYTLDLEHLDDFCLKSLGDTGKFKWGADSGGTIGGVDTDGNIYVSDGYYKKKSRRKPPTKDKKKPTKEELDKRLADRKKNIEFYRLGLLGVIRRYNKDGKIQNESLAQMTWGSGSLALDSKGNMYVLDLIGAHRWTYVSHNIPCGLGRGRTSVSGARGPSGLIFKRGDYPVWQQSDICYLVKFGPGGGRRYTETELWAHRGFSPHTAGGCKCDWPRGIVTVDAADRIFATDSVHHHVKVLDTEGNLVVRIGWWGNAEDVPADGDAAKLGFWSINSLATFDECLYVCDKDLRRIAKIRMAYRETIEIKVE
ncbi:MAG TPA: hypothetical protein ENL37_04270 [Desulfobacteraceae bacterium]|nr:hypothetical protein [Desulfobacteraceae bacterium]